MFMKPSIVSPLKPSWFCESVLWACKACGSISRTDAAANPRSDLTDRILIILWNQSEYVF